MQRAIELNFIFMSVATILGFLLNWEQRGGEREGTNKEDRRAMKNVNKYNKQRTTRNLFRLITRVEIKVMFASTVLRAAPRPSNSVEKKRSRKYRAAVVSPPLFLRHLRSILVAREIYFYDARKGEINDAPYIRTRNPEKKNRGRGKKSLFHPSLIKLSISTPGTYVFAGFES